MHWKDIINKEYSKTDKLILKSLKTKIKWHELSNDINPYSLQPIEDIEYLVGRSFHINKIIQGLKSSESFSIFGQKRVGKTSIGKSLYNQILKDKEEKFVSFLPIYSSIGDIISMEFPTGYLGYTIAADVYDNFLYKRGFNPNVVLNDEKEFNNNFSRIISFFKSFHRAYPDINIIIFIDEFDELPANLYLGDTGNRFFLTLRAITELPFISLIMIGGEKLPIISNYQGAKLNKIQYIDIDYFDINNRQEIEDLIQLPILEHDIELSKQAMNRIIDYSGGNPFYVMTICNYCYNEILRNEISSVGKTDIDSMLEKQMEVLKVPSFQHFWEDGKIGTEEEVAWWGFYNSRILITISQLSDHNNFISLNKIKDVLKRDKIIQENEIEKYIDELCRRKVLIKNKDSDEYKFRINFLRDWLKFKGKEEINLLYKNSNYLKEAIVASKKYTISTEQLRALEKKFKGFYIPINQNQLRIFLNQFISIFGQREAWLAYKILEHVKLYSRSEIESIFKDLFKIILNDVVEIINKLDGSVQKFGINHTGPKLIKAIKYQNVFLTRIDSEGKSGSEMVRIFSMANSILESNVINPLKVKELICSSDVSNIVIFVDDFIGSGDSAVKNFNKFFSDLPETIINKHYFYYCVICAQSQGIRNIQQKVKQINKINAYNYLGEEQKAFSAENTIFNNIADISDAKRIFEQIGTQLQKNNPLGYDGGEALVVFYDNSPNNTLPALIKSGLITSENQIHAMQWEALFLRR